MSSYVTHFLCGAVGGLALARVLEPSSACLDIGAVCAPEAPIQSGLLVTASGFAALLPDIDEPNSWVGRRVRWTTAIVVGLLLALLGWAIGGVLPPSANGSVPPRLLMGAAGLGVGMGIIGPIAGSMLLSTIRAAAGGHRRLTHSLVLSLPLALGAALLWVLDYPLLALLPGLLAWGQWLHLVGDVVTVAGVPLWYPISTATVRVFPEPMARVGEPIVLALALACGAWLGLPFVGDILSLLDGGAR